MKRRVPGVRKAIVVGVSAVLLTSAVGCYGRFRAVNAVSDFNKTASDSPVVRSLLMWGLIFIPVYEVSFLVDAVVLNMLDFFNGTGDPKPAVARAETLPDGTQLQLAKVDADTMRVRHVDAAGRASSFDVVRVGAHAGYLRVGDGRIVGSVEQLPDGRVIRRTP